MSIDVKGERNNRPNGVKHQEYFEIGTWGILIQDQDCRCCRNLDDSHDAIQNEEDTCIAGNVAPPYSFQSVPSNCTTSLAHTG